MARMTFRLTEEIRAWLEEQAAKNGRTMNGELSESIRKLMEGTAKQAVKEAKEIEEQKKAA